MIIKTNDFKTIRKIIKKLAIPKTDSHKGENGRIIIIGGSKLLHCASLWAAEIASRFVDIVHYSSTVENNKIFINLKSKFLNGIVVRRKDLLDYINEDDVVLIGPGMIRDIGVKNNPLFDDFNKLIQIKNEPRYLINLIYYLSKNFPQKQFVFDAGALYMIKPEFFFNFKKKPVITPHQYEFFALFGVDIRAKTFEEKVKILKKIALNYRLNILLKAIDDFITDGESVIVVRGGNPGLTKGGSGDVLVGLVASLLAKNESKVALTISSLVVKLASEELAKEFGYWYNIEDLIKKIPQVINRFIFDK